MTGRRAALAAAAKSRLVPPEYREIAYLGFTGEQWFDTGIYLNGSAKIELDIAPTAVSADTIEVFFGSYDGTYNTIVGKTGRSNYNIVFSYGSAAGAARTKTIPFSNQSAYTARKIITADSASGFRINDTNVNITDPHVYTNGLTAYFGNVHRDDGSFPARMTSGRARIWENGSTLSRFYIPVRRLSDNAGGMWDAVNRTFSPSMTGVAFAKGADV